MAVTALNCGRMPIKKLIKDMIMRSSLMAIIDFRDLILVSPNFTYCEVMEQLVRQALEEFERKCPLFKRSKVYIPGNHYTFVDNFESFLSGDVTEEYLTLIPKVVYSLDKSLLHARRDWIYQRPMISEIYSLGRTFVEYMCSYPCVFKSEDEVDEFTDDSAIYFLSIEGGMTQDLMFKHQFYLTVMTYVNNIKNNLQYPDLPIQLLQGIEIEIQKYEQLLTEFYRKANAHGRLLR